ncbi:MAG TPA: hypothetical protein VE465_27635 [Streptosporangiaceae bacterium]|nr:hypothetical protein [Streptosporangiaceae bacterium]
MRTRLVRALAAASMIVLAAANRTTATATSGDDLSGPLRVGVIPNVSPETQRAHYEPLRRYLAGRLKTKVSGGIKALRRS